jgi:hypothetical protein
MSDKIPPERVLMVWNDEITDGRILRHGQRVTELRVLDFADQIQWPPEQGRFAAWRGASDSDWLQGDPRATPMGVFLMLLVLHDFADDVKIQALREFSKIEGQAWATDFLRELGAAPDNAT